MVTFSVTGMVAILRSKQPFRKTIKTEVSLDRLLGVRVCTFYVYETSMSDGRKFRQNKLHKTVPTKRRIEDGGERIN